MPQPFVSEIRIFPWGVVPDGWAPCDGAAVRPGDHRALFDAIGTTYGGDGTTAFNVPDLRGRVPLGAGDRDPLGKFDGEETHTLTPQELPLHSHLGQASPALEGDTSVAGDHVLCGQALWAALGPPTPLRPDSIDAAGADQPHDNMAPFLALNFCIALEGAAA